MDAATDPGARRGHAGASRLQLPLEALHATDASGNETGLLAAVVNLSGCSAAFVSPDGLIATNHHCAYGAIQAASSVEHDYLAAGFLARTRAEELPAKNTTVQIVESVTDVTAQIRAVADGEPEPEARAKAVSRLRKQLVLDCEAAASASALPRGRLLRRRGGAAHRLARVHRRSPGVRATFVGRQLRRRGRQLDVAAAHGRLLAAARVCRPERRSGHARGHQRALPTRATPAARARRRRARRLRGGAGLPRLDPALSTGRRGRALGRAGVPRTHRSVRRVDRHPRGRRRPRQGGRDQGRAKQKGSPTGTRTRSA
ncbi:MAG: S46 family peptidase [Deltaproteobacteria bacterium]|nr:S46 family peptidase [Deltaproteobacteria bacterium]